VLDAEDRGVLIALRHIDHGARLEPYAVEYGTIVFE
jgi:hypothetical protein